eukprot:SAG11_NODE_11459_length_759_cov_1.521212_1_plen_29_part_10
MVPEFLAKIGKFLPCSSLQYRKIEGTHRS